MRVWVLFAIVAIAWIAAPLAAAPANGQGAPPGVPTGIDKRCVKRDWNDHILYVTNLCGYPIRAMWFFGKSISFGKDLGPGQSVSTGRDQADLDKWGDANIFACPLDHARFLDAKGKGIVSGDQSSGDQKIYYCALPEVPFQTKKH